MRQTTRSVALFSLALGTLAPALSAHARQDAAPAGTPAYPHDEAWIRELGGLMYDRDYEPAATERQLSAIYASRDRRPALPSINTPTTILHGDSDNLIDPAGAKELHELIHDSTLTIYPGMGHSLPRELWDDLITEIRTNTRESAARRA